VRALLLTTPLGEGAPNGATLAAVDLARAFVQSGRVRPVLLARRGARVPEGCEAIAIATRVGRPVEALAAVARARADVVHAMFAPRLATGLALRAVAAGLRVPIVQTIASSPRGGRIDPRALAGAIVVATSAATHAQLIAAGVDERRVVEIPLPFAPTRALDVPRDAPPGRYLLFAGDYEFGEAIEPTLDAFAQLAPPRGMHPTLVVAARPKTPRARSIERTIARRIEASPALRGRVRVLGEVPSLLPWILGAAAVLLPARDTFAKIDHPRVLLEAISLGVPIVVGSAPTLVELVREAGDDAIGEVASDVPSLREAMERALVRPALSPASVLPLLEARRPERIAEAYEALYARALRELLR
jgi:glycosyltransferase involved in cell wall biosynthesis